MVRLIDCTLREGAQAANVIWSIEKSLAIVRGLVDFGVDCIEAGHPSANDQEFQRTQAIASFLDGTPLLAHARAQVADVRCVKEVGAQWVGIFAGVNEESRRLKFNNRSVPEILAMVESSIAFAKSIGLKVRFTLEDGSRTDWALQRKAYQAAISAGADRVCFTDTIGMLTPTDARGAIQRLRALARQTPIEVHFHNDRGMALANAVEVAPMVDWISCSVNGIGERCGITDTVAMRGNMDFDRDGTMTQTRVALSKQLCTMVEAFARNSLMDRRPIVGQYAFTHCADLHIKAFNRDLNAYCWLADYPGQAVHRNAAVPLASYVNATPEVISATELKHRRAGPGNSYLMMDEHVAPNVRQYCIVREITALVDNHPSYVDEHTHSCDSLFLFLGDEPGKTGLRVKVKLGSDEYVLDSPASVFIPAGEPHTYSVLQGKGALVNHVLAQNYNQSLLECDWIKPHDIAKSAPVPDQPLARAV